MSALALAVMLALATGWFALGYRLGRADQRAAHRDEWERAQRLTRTRSTDMRIDDLTDRIGRGTGGRP